LLLNADVLNSQHAGTGATWRINMKILSTCRGRRHIVSPRAQLVCTSNPHRFSLWKTYAGNQACWTKHLAWSVQLNYRLKTS